MIATDRELETAVRREARSKARWLADKAQRDELIRSAHAYLSTRDLKELTGLSAQRLRQIYRDARI